MASVARKIDAPIPTSEHDDPVLAAFLRAPMDDRQETDEERAAVEAAKAAFRASGTGVPHAEVVAALTRRRSEG
jgi:hypothetical protein